MWQSHKPSTNSSLRRRTFFNIPERPRQRLEPICRCSATDGYEVVFSVAELDPNLGAPNDLVPYADTGGQFPADGLARIVIPGDNHAGRFVSNLDSLDVEAIPEPGTASLYWLNLLPIFHGCRKRDGKWT